MFDNTRRIMASLFGSGDETTLLLQPEVGRSQTWPHLSDFENMYNNSWWSALTFSWISPIMDAGSKGPLQFCNLPSLPQDMSPAVCCSHLFKNWEAEREREKQHPSLFRAMFCAYGRSWMVVGLLKIINDCLSFAGPFFLNKILTFLESGSEDLKYSYWCAGGLGLVSLIRAFLGAHYTFLLCRLRLRVKASITSIVYQKALCVSLSERTSFSSGEIQTFMSVDAERCANLVNCGHEVWSLPLQMASALWMLYTQVKFAFVAGLIVIIVLIPVNKWIAKFICAANESMMKEKDDRVRHMGEILMHIRTLKMYTWEKFFLRRVMQSRKQELKYLAVKKYLDACCVYFWACTPTIFSLLTFGLLVLLGNTLTAATVFTSLALFNILIGPLNSFPWVINGVIEAQVSLGRLRKFLACLEVDSQWTKGTLYDVTGLNEAPTDLGDTNGPYDGDLHLKSEGPDSMAVVLKSAVFSWSHSLITNPALIISQVSLAIPNGSLVVILGKVGSGKSSLLEAILGEMRCIEGSMLVKGRLAYVSQTPWIQAGTLCENVLFGQPYNADRYKNVINACALDVDIQQMQGGNLAEIGERGVNLSGGQRARLALARALYQDCDTYLLDDPLSAVDAHVAAWLMKHAIGGQQMIKKTRIMCTHHAQAISFADMVLIMENGRLTSCGLPGSDRSTDSESPNILRRAPAEIPLDLLSDEFTQHDTSVVPTVLSSKPSANINALAFDQKPVRNIVQFMSPTKHVYSACPRNQKNLASSTLGLEQSSIPQSVLTKSMKLIEEEDRLQGRVQATVYRAYGGFVQWTIIAIILVSISLMQATRNASDYWLAQWVDKEDSVSGQLPPNSFIRVYIALGITNSVVTLARSFSFAYGGIRAASQVHKVFIKKVITAPIRFFDQNPSGRILNRFASDQYIIDDSLPFVVNNLLAQLFNLIGIAVILCFIQWLFLVLLIPIIIIYNLLQKYYRATSRELRRLDGISRSPIYSSFTEALEGAATIRAFGAQAHFAATNLKNVHTNLRVSYSELCASLWFSIRLQTLAAFFMLVISIVAIFSHENKASMRPLSAGLVGLGLSYASPVITTLNNLLANFTETEKDMVSMERIQQYMELESEPNDGTDDVSSEWPASGEVEFSRVTLSYLPSLPPALCDLSFRIPAGEQVGIAGRTGAGKSSILSVLFRLSAFSKGQILIDGVNISTVPLQLLRSRLSVVPQTPMLFEGTLRQNLDPSGNIADSELWIMLEKCHMKDAITKAGGLDLFVSESGESLSLGERQLLCLARALLSCGQILCLDECTANIDPLTTTLLMETVASECKDMTVIIIAHRIATILDSDRILILDKGTLIEEGKPKELLAIPTSKFSGLVGVSGVI